MQNKPVSSASGLDSRRGFLKKAATAAAAVASTGFLKTPVYGQSQSPSAGVAGANNRIVVGYIGIGGKPSNCPGMGLAHVESQKANAAKNNIAQAAVCDLWDVRNQVARQAIGGSDVQTFGDYRKMLERKDIDAVLIATHDVWHAQCSIDAMEAGKHVYCEKPLTRYLDEAFKIQDAVQRTGKVFQIGSQGTSAAGWREAAKLIQAGKIGKMVWGQGYYCRNNPKGEWNYSMPTEASADTVNWNMWLGPVQKKVPFIAEHFFRWRKFYPYCSGLLGDLVPHRLLPLMVATGNPEFPSRVVCLGTRKVGTDEGDLQRDVPEHVQLIAEFPSGLMLTVVSSTVNERSPGFAIYGQKATINIGNAGERLELLPERPFSEEVDPVRLDGLTPHEDVAVHEANWFDCIRTNKQPNGNIDLAVKSQAVISLAEMSDRMKTTCLFDEKTRKLTTDGGKEVKPLTYGSIDLS